MPTLAAISNPGSAQPIATSLGQTASGVRAQATFASSLAAAQSQSAAQPSSENAVDRSALNGEGAAASTSYVRSPAGGNLPAKKQPPSNLPGLSIPSAAAGVLPQAAPSLPVSGIGIANQTGVQIRLAPPQSSAVPANFSTLSSPSFSSFSSSSSYSLSSLALGETPPAQAASRTGAAPSVPPNDSGSGPSTVAAGWLSHGASGETSNRAAWVSNSTPEVSKSGSISSENASLEATNSTSDVDAMSQLSSEISANQVPPRVETTLASAPVTAAPQRNLEQGAGVGLSGEDLPLASNLTSDPLVPASSVKAQLSWVGGPDAPVLIASNEETPVSVSDALPAAQSKPSIQATGGAAISAVIGAVPSGALLGSSGQPGPPKSDSQLAPTASIIPATSSNTHATQAVRLSVPTSAATAAGQANQPLEAGSQTPFSVFFSEPRQATESAAATLPKVIFTSTSATVGNHNANADATNPGPTPPSDNGHNAGPANSRNPSPSITSASVPAPPPQHPSSDGNAVIAGAAVATVPVPPAPAGAASAPVIAAPPTAQDAPVKISPPSAMPGGAGTPTPPEVLSVPAAGPVQIAQMVSRIEQSEMRIGMNTSAFGSVEVRAVVHSNDVGLVVGSEKGDLRSLMSSELPAMANTLQEQNLRLHSVNFMQGFAFSNNSSGGGDSQPRSFVPQQAALSTASPPVSVNDSSETMAQEELNGVHNNLSILA